MKNKFNLFTHANLIKLLNLAGYYIKDILIYILIIKFNGFLFFQLQKQNNVLFLTCIRININYRLNYYSNNI